MQSDLQIMTLSVGPIRANCYILSLPDRDDCVLIDPGAQPERILNLVRNKRIAAILLTHGHFDHIGGVAGVLADDTKLYIHTLDEPMLMDPNSNMSVMIGQELVVNAADLPVKDGDVISAAGITFTVLHTPGHTPGSVCYQAGKALFTGDTMFRHGYGRTDLPGGSWDDLFTSMKRLLLLQKDFDVYPGHDNPTTIGQEQGCFQ